MNAKKVLKYVLVAALVGLAGWGVIKDLNKVNDKKDAIRDVRTVTHNGFLKVEGNKILNQNNEEVQLTGISSHGIQWFDDLYGYENLKELKEEWGINVFRVSMYTDPDANGYIANRELKDKVYEIIDDCISLDMYVVVDWHNLKDNNPLTYKAEALEFFGEVSEKYKDVPNVIYEICNEPNGNVTWHNSIRAYAEELVAKIRENTKDSLVIVGTPDYARELTTVMNAPLEAENIVYAVHFYAGTDGDKLRKRIDKFTEAGLAVFVSECGMTDSTGDGAIYEDEFRGWIDYLNEKKISWIYWSLANKAEASALLLPNYEKTARMADYLSESGKIVKKLFE